MKAKRILDEILAKGESLPSALILCFMEKHGVNPVAELVRADRRRRLVRWLTFPLFIFLVVTITGSMTEQYRDGIITGNAVVIQIGFYVLVGTILMRLALPYVFTVSYNDHEEDKFFYDLERVRGRLCPFTDGEPWNDKGKLRERALKVLCEDAEAIRISRVYFGEFSVETRGQERVMKEDCALFLFYNLLPQFEDAKEAYRAAFDWANQQEIPESKTEATAKGTYLPSTL